MGSDKGFVEAHHSLIDPLIEPDPSDDTGLNNHFTSTFAPRPGLHTPPDSAGSQEFPSATIRNHNTGSSVNSNPFVRSQNTGNSVETNPYRRSRASSASQGPAPHHGETTPRRSSKYEYPSPPNSASPRREHFSRDHRREAFGSISEGRPRRSSQPTGVNPMKGGGLTRGGSLRERYPGDPSTRPLDTIRKETKNAHRAPHLRKKNFTGADIIDRLDKTTIGGAAYHHEGPYDATNLSRNLDFKHSPVAAVAESNEEALRATPKENIVDSVQKHRPLEGVAIVPPGVPDRMGRTYDYKEGADLMREPGADYKRWAGVTYHPDDLKGKGEPSYSIEKALKDHKAYGDTGSEMQSHRRNVSMGSNGIPGHLPSESLDAGTSSGIGRSNTTGKSVGSALKKRFGSMRRKKVEA
ncbi:uncharacterized protein CC84DRAFT_1162775 [Paraphaeosphaeria sporulosa]|uniref:Pal1-domain-containing protein n=1 Tax=Paraphaeosphaeria sporulosa TaxID=1460663 RepID=A0A177CNV1_9PLEO|nr:uncharacterized protein CC84DRAFT_1162775 [Paraphaeosphaeria sporulosa]OAG08966.1 hypothetical protein CC84DRAFT_1162775 [Paraphaeosphaeria sporulosa]